MNIGIPEWGRFDTVGQICWQSTHCGFSSKLESGSEMMSLVLVGLPLRDDLGGAGREVKEVVMSGAALRGELFRTCIPGASKKAMKSITKTIRDWKIHRGTSEPPEQVA